VSLLPRETFRIRPRRRSRRFFVVHVADDHDAMLAELRRCGIEPEPFLLATCVSASALDGQGGYRHLLGALFFYRQTCRVGLVAHELGHASLRALERLRRLPSAERRVVMEDGQRQERASPREELFCDILQHLTAEFWNRWWDVVDGRGHDGAPARSEP
jgi:hypothetical protein